jgi:hypothetical protein
MSNQGVRGFYQLTQTIKNQLLTDINVKSVSTGNFSDIDVQKQSIFPLSHIIIESASQEDGVLRFSIRILSMDIVNQSKKATTDLFVGNNDEQDILNTQLAVVNRLVQVLRGGSLHQDGYQLDGNAALSPFYDRFDNELAGWEASFDILLYNDIKIC